MLSTTTATARACSMARWSTSRITARRHVAQCRKAALARGVGSSLSLPLRDGPRVLGALNLYADERSAFGGPSHDVADVLARQATAAVRYLELLHSERQRGLVQGQIAATLQRSLLRASPSSGG